MEWYYVILRFIHIVAGIFWVGSAGFMILFIAPAVAELRETGGQFMKALMMQKGYTVYFPAIASLTAIPGLIVFYKTTGEFNSDFMGTTPGIVLSTGVLFGLAAWLHGGATLGRKTGELMTLAQAIGNNRPTEEQQSQMVEMQQYIGKHSRMSFAMQMIAIICMAAWRYA